MDTFCTLYMTVFRSHYKVLKLSTVGNHEGFFDYWATVDYKTNCLPDITNNTFLNNTLLFHKLVLTRSSSVKW